jgi:signal transduction histidine kinase
MMEDTGPSIPEKDLKKIFELLYTTKMEGTGLGLAGCKNIVQSHKGTITVHNNPTTFTITLPKNQLKSPQIHQMIVQTLKE